MWSQGGHWRSTDPKKWTVESGVGRTNGEVRVIMSWDITVRGIVTRRIMVRGIRGDECSPISDLIIVYY